MLYITWTEQGKEYKRVWYVTEPFPDITGQVVKFQADGHELDAMIQALTHFRYIYKTGG